MSYLPLVDQLVCVADAERAKRSAWFFKTQQGEYGYGDQFFWISVPELRKIAKQHWLTTTRDDLRKLFNSEIHEHRFIAWELLHFHYKAKQPVYTKQACIDFYLDNVDHCNNRDLVDNTAYSLLGDRLFDKKDRKILYDLASSKNLWRMRVAIVSTIAFVRSWEIQDTYAIAELLLIYQIATHPHTEFGGRSGRELTNKAVWRLLRETWYVNKDHLETFLHAHAATMPRTMLRYSIEKMSSHDKKKWLKF